MTTTTPQHRHSFLSADSSLAPPPSTLTSPPPPPKTKTKRIRPKTERRREQCRVYQERYRNKEKHAIVELEIAIQRVHRDIADAQRLLNTLDRGVNNHDAASAAVVECMRVIRHGLNLPQRRRQLTESAIFPLQSMQVLRPPSSSLDLTAQTSCIEALFEPNVRIGESIGRGYYLQQLYFSTIFYDDLDITLDQLDCVTLDDAGSSLTARITMAFTITATTIKHVFPHLLEPACAQIKWKLLGQRLRCPSIGRYVFNDRSKITQLDWSIDMTTALLKVLTIAELAVVLGHAQIQQDAYLITDEVSPIPSDVH